ncbi:hypothetical protein NPIL_580301, partial [Nephila pilipes]
VEGGNECMYFLRRGQFMATKREQSSGLLDFTFLKSFRKDHLKDKALIIKAQLSLSSNHDNKSTSYFDHHLMKLSADISKLLDYGAYHDFTLKAGGFEYKVHKCIVAFRWPYVTSMNSSTVEIENVSPGGLHKILEYVYFYPEIRIEPPYYSELLHSTQISGLHDLESLLQSYPHGYHIITPMRHETLIFNHDLTRIVKWPENLTTETRILSISDFNVEDFMVIFNLAKDKEGRKYLGISFQFSHFVQHKPILLRCKMALRNQKNELLNPWEFSTVLYDGNLWKLPPYFTEEKYPEAVAQELKSLRFEVLLCDGMDKTKVDFFSSKYPITRSKCLINDPVKLSDYLHGLMEAPAYSDVDLILNGKGVQLHKAILGARSPWFQKYFNENCNDSETRCVITLNDFDETIVMQVIEYMYSGRITIQNLKVVPELSKVAQLLQLKELSEMCEKAMSVSL